MCHIHRFCLFGVFSWSSRGFRDFHGSTPSTTCTSLFAVLHVCQGVICCLNSVILEGMLDAIYARTPELKSPMLKIRL